MSASPIEVFLTPIKPDYIIQGGGARGSASGLRKGLCPLTLPRDSVGDTIILLPRVYPKNLRFGWRNIPPKKRKPPIPINKHGSAPKVSKGRSQTSFVFMPFGAPAGASPLHERRTALRTPNERNNNTEKTLICFGRWQSNVLLARLHHLARRSSLRR